MQSRVYFIFSLSVLILFTASGCGVFYQAGMRIKTSRMSDELKTGESMSQIHTQFGEPDLHEYPNDTTEIWSYVYKPNSNDVTAALLYTSTKEGDQGTFLDLKFVNGTLVSWAEAQHTMPTKQRSGFGAGMGGPPLPSSPGAPPSAVGHY
ncbi:MAG: hypothetical protein ACLQAT_01590 [Candidatus Binataceae bacterium]